MNRSRIPTGFKKMDIEITYETKQFEVFKNAILRLLLRDYHVFYSVKKYSSFYRVFFYCQPSVEASFTYRLGVYNQTMFNYNSNYEIITSDHVVGENYIEDYLLEIN